MELINKSGNRRGEWGYLGMQILMDLKDRSYPIHLEAGSLHHLRHLLTRIWQPQKVVLVTDSRVGPLYADLVTPQLSGVRVFIFEIPEGEGSKSLTWADKLWNFCAEKGLTRLDGILALGGGVVGDLAGFVASTYLRGIHLIQIPTSLTAQVDSSVGGKTGINSGVAKNMIGTFAQPDAVIIDPDLLRSLSVRTLKEGMGEVIKCAAIADLELWSILERMSGEDILEQADFLITHAIQVKKKLVEEDELDRGSRLFLNFGHTLGHAIERVSDYEVMHGEAVAIGMIKVSKRYPEVQEKIRQMVAKFGLPTDYHPWELNSLMAAVEHDKKAGAGFINLVLVPHIGQVQVESVSMVDVEALLKDEV